MSVGEASVKRLLLVGAGHAHAQLLRDWVARPVPGVDLQLVSPSALAPYSGMVPGWLAGIYRFDDICIDFAALAHAAGARLQLGELVALDPLARRVQLADGTALDYDWLSLNVGSTLAPPVQLQPPSGAAPQVLSLRPLGGLHRAWQALLARPPTTHAGTPLQVTAVGGGAAGVESLLAVLARLRALQPGRVLSGRLVTRAPSLLPGMAPGAQRAAAAALHAAGVQVQIGAAFDPQTRTDLLLWAAGALAHRWQRDSGLAVAESGFIRIDACLRSVSHPSVLAVGDCAEWGAGLGQRGDDAQPLPKAGVFAVRMGPVLSHNLRAALTGQPLRIYQPQRRFLALLATADRQAIASWGRWSAQGRWVWRWKDHIDRQFVQRFAVPQPPPAPPSPAP